MTATYRHPRRRAEVPPGTKITFCVRGVLALFLANIALYRARLFRDPEALAEARRLIEAHHYGRRLPELVDTEAYWEGRPPAS